MHSAIIFIFVAITAITARRKGESCVTPNKEIATCMPIKECSILLKTITKRDDSIIAFLRKSQCGYEDQQVLVCCGTSVGFTASVTTVTERDSVLAEVCGYHNERLLGGTIPFIDEYPWVVALEYQKKENKQNAGFMCGGSLISSRFVLTAGHCLVNENYEVIRAWLGEHQFSTDPDCEGVPLCRCNDPVQKITIAEKIPHPQYNPHTRENDIGLLRLEKDIEYTDGIQPVCLSTHRFPSMERYEHSAVVGWGISEKGALSDIKRKTDVMLLNHDVCRSKHNIQLASNQLCFTDKGINGSCWGGSGGPIHGFKVLSPGSPHGPWYQEGVVSWSTGCDYAVYTQISTYIDWIVHNVKK